MIPFRVLKGLKANLPTTITDGTIYVCVDTDEVFIDNVYNRIQLSNVQPNWAQTDEIKVDYIKNKPELGNLAAKNTVEKSDLSMSVQTSLDNANIALTSVDELSAGVAYIDDADNENIGDVVDTAPNIGANGNWFIGNIDTGIKAEGKDGYTPQKGVDYFTEADKKEISQEVFDEAVGDINTALDNIISIQEELMIPNGDEVSY